MSDPNSIQVARAAIRMALSATREEERALKAQLAEEGILAAAADYGGDFINLLKKGVERAVVVAVREGLVADTEAEQGVVAGAAHEAISQVLTKALGLSVGGKIGVARRDSDISVAVFLSVGLLHLNEVAIGLAHRAIG
ncbi:MAG TPA: HutP family protein [Symbiobacteriaceae bacterium]